MSHILRNYKAAASCKKYLTTQFDYILKNVIMIILCGNKIDVILINEKKTKCVRFK